MDNTLTKADSNYVNTHFSFHIANSESISQVFLLGERPLAVRSDENPLRDESCKEVEWQGLRGSVYGWYKTELLNTNAHSGLIMYVNS